MDRTKSTIAVSVPAKIHLIGEHSVVYGGRAILAAIDKRAEVTLKPRGDKNIILSLNNAEIKTSFGEIIAVTKNAKKLWEEYQKLQDKNLLKKICPDSERFIKIAIGESFRHSGEQSDSRISLDGDPGQARMTHLNGFDLRIDSEIPIGCGLGSSAAIAVGIAGAVSLFLKKPFDKKVINEIAFEIEKRKHGNPSGGDNTTCCYGGLLAFQKEKNELRIMNYELRIANKLRKNFMIINTGKPKESTGEMVHSVAQLLTTNKQLLTEFLESQERLVIEMENYLSNPGLQVQNQTRIVGLMRATEKNLERVGVVSPSVKKIIRAIEKSGGAAKICGGGGKTKGTGILLVYHENREAMRTIAKTFGLKVESIELGTDGVRIE